MPSWFLYFLTATDFRVRRATGLGERDLDAAFALAAGFFVLARGAAFAFGAAFLGAGDGERARDFAGAEDPVGPVKVADTVTELSRVP